MHTHVLPYDFTFTFLLVGFLLTWHKWTRSHHCHPFEVWGQLKEGCVKLGWNKWRIWLGMPPKKKVRTKKKPGKNMESKGPVLIDGFPLSEMSKEQLEGHVKTLLEKVRNPVLQKLPQLWTNPVCRSQGSAGKGPMPNWKETVLPQFGKRSQSRWRSSKQNAGDPALKLMIMRNLLWKTHHFRVKGGEMQEAEQRYMVKY